MGDAGTIYDGSITGCSRSNEVCSLRSCSIRSWRDFSSVEDQVMRLIILLDSGDQPLLPEHT